MSDTPSQSHNDLVAKTLREHPEFAEEYALEDERRDLGRVLWGIFVGSGLTKTELAKRMHTSISSIDRLFNAGSGGSCTATTLFKFGRATGEKVFAHQKCRECNQLSEGFVLGAMWTIEASRRSNLGKVKLPRVAFQSEGVYEDAA